MLFLEDLFLNFFSSSCTPYTTPLSTVIANLSANYCLCADDTRLLWSFSAADFTDSISLLEQIISTVYNWMPSNFYSVNPSKTEFLLVGLPQQLSKLSNPMIHQLTMLLCYPYILLVIKESSLIAISLF
jgi:hypothetical protein